MVDSQIRYYTEKGEVFRSPEEFIQALAEPHPFKYDIKTRYLEDYIDRNLFELETAFYRVSDYRGKKDQWEHYAKYHKCFEKLWEADYV
jgi:hypothetical protein